MRSTARARRPAFFVALASACVSSLHVGCASTTQSAHGLSASPASIDRVAPSPPPAAPTASTNLAPTTDAPPVGIAPLTRRPELALDPRQPMRALPKLEVENIGLHVGGGPNDAETKAPFLRAIAERFPQFMDCYRKTDEPARGGRFGVDLHISRAGGHPHLEQPRTSMLGQEFRACVSAAFESVQFAKPKGGPTTISYSLHFTIGDKP